MKINRRNFLKLSIGTVCLITLSSPKKVEAVSSTGREGKAVLVDTTKCIGCGACVVACKQKNRLPRVSFVKAGNHDNPPKLDAYNFTRVNSAQVLDEGKPRWAFAKQQCMHCQHPACAEACIVGALKKTPEGPVTYDDRKCIGCRYCQVACPFGIPTFEWDKPVPWIKKCDFCADLIARGLKPACVAACPMGVLQFGERADLLTEAKNRIGALPARYVDYIYGEKEVGGTSWLYIASLPFEKLGLNKHINEPVTVNVARAMGFVPPVLVTVAALMSGIYLLTQRRQKLAKVKAEDEEKPEVKNEPAKT